MKLSRSAPLAGLALLAALAALPGRAGDQALEALVTAEKEFSALSVYKGMKGAFLTYLADDGVIFRPTAVNGKKSWGARENPNATLVWEPAFAEVSAGGDLGYNTGPWELRFPAESGREALHGHFVSVWKKQADGEWRVMVDLGVSHPKPESAGVGSGRFTAGPENATPWKLATGPGDLKKRDAALSKAARAGGLGPAFAAVATRDVRFNREGSFPFVGFKAALAEVEQIAGTLRWVPQGAGVASSRDLGYTYGVAERYEAGAKTVADSSVYLHVWRRDGEDWRLALAVLNPLTRARP